MPLPLTKKICPECFVSGSFSRLVYDEGRDIYDCTCGRSYWSDQLEDTWLDVIERANDPVVRRTIEKMKEAALHAN